MPMFEFRCTRCGHEFEELVFGNRIPECPECHAQETEKMVSRPCRFFEGGAAGDGAMPSSSSSGGCSGCSGGNCAGCAH